jgi:hypothetical protein
VRFRFSFAPGAAKQPERQNLAERKIWFAVTASAQNENARQPAIGESDE